MLKEWQKVSLGTDAWRYAMTIGLSMPIAADRQKHRGQCACPTLPNQTTR